MEAEVGTVGGEEDGVYWRNPICRLGRVQTDCSRNRIDCLAPALGSVHGPYKGEPNLGFKEMKKFLKRLKIPLVLHGGTGIPLKDIQKAISLGTAKINVNTENQMAQTAAVRKVLEEKPELYDPRKYLGPGTRQLNRL